MSLEELIELMLLLNKKILGAGSEGGTGKMNSTKKPQTVFWVLSLG